MDNTMTQPVNYGVVSERERGKGVAFSRIRRITGVRRVLN